MSTLPDESTPPVVTGADAALIAEANAALEGAPADPTAAPSELPAPSDVQPWGPFIHAAIKPMVFGVGLPQWGVALEAQDEWCSALGECLDQAFPGGPAGRYACWARLILGTVTIGGLAYIQGGGKFPPFGPKRIELKTDAGAAS